MQGLFITVEGPDGAGKTSVIQELVPRLKKIATRPVVVTREPGGSRIAEKIRQLILDKQNTEMDARTEALLYAASRRQHLVEKIMPALAADEIVICDRFVDSSLAYQGAARKLGIQEVAAMNLFATEGLTPALTLYLDVDSDTGLQRIYRNRQNEINRLDVEAPQFHQLVRHGYLKVLAENPERMVKIDARQPLADVVEDCYDIVIKRAPNFFQ
ncbi:dTMP kinase [Enterococcus nangangensis]|uniref:dTMP kinase n=1 Tax=Enterococcus nangangensis TaxID=2559926 RepID=UPI0010F93A67|nr:dTMP kinase [Enterococcus nangangensis]